MKILYQCEICKVTYTTIKKAQKCEKSSEKPRYKVGDIVTARSGFGWFDGDKRWIRNFQQLGMFTAPGVMPGKKNHGNCFDNCCTYEFYYVITHIGHKPHEPHEVAYTLATKAMTKDTGYHAGYTTHNGSHCTPVLVENPPVFIVKDSKDLIGFESKSLL